MQLYGTATSPYVRKVRVLLIEKGIECDFVSESPSDPAGNVASNNPLGKVPVLVLDEGRSLFDSMVILDYLDSMTGVPLCPAQGSGRWEVMRWHALAQGILDAAVARLLETRRPVEKQMAEVVTKQEIKILAALRFAGEQLPSGDQMYLSGGRFSLADIAVGVALGYLDLRFPHPWREQHRGLARWYSRIGERRSFLETVPPVG